MYNQGEIETKERRKVVFFAGATVAVILALIVAIVVVAINKSNRETVGIAGNNSDKGEFSLEASGDDEQSEANEAADKAAENLAASIVGSVSNQTASESTTEAEAPAPAPTVTEMPATGAADLLGVALSLGGLTTAGTALAMRKRA